MNTNERTVSRFFVFLGAVVAAVLLLRVYYVLIDYLGHEGIVDNVLSLQVQFIVAAAVSIVLSQLLRISRFVADQLEHRTRLVTEPNEKVFYAGFVLVFCLFQLVGAIQAIFRPAVYTIVLESLFDWSLNVELRPNNTVVLGILSSLSIGAYSLFMDCWALLWSGELDDF
ncbi:hypothetical protein KU306_02440 [Haloferax larsenii]|uniref:Tripartite ATP-independent transporter, DctQ component n=1 Tax=Haloferax larsenii TaxID=302484 RepID=A0ABY5RF36_HALLR|nr:hypothetical protein [Haloferax larsenii]UVE50769.1 hypothetical protein KU306_02440 [Haloferax larsenii]